MVFSASSTRGGQCTPNSPRVPIYAGSRIRTAEKKPSTQSGEKGKKEGQGCFAPPLFDRAITLASMQSSAHLPGDYFFWGELLSTPQSGNPTSQNNPPTHSAEY